MFFTALSRCQVKFMAMQGTNDFAVTNDTFRQGALTVRASVLDGGNFAVAAAKDRD